MSPVNSNRMSGAAGLSTAIVVAVAIVASVGLATDRALAVAMTAANVVWGSGAGASAVLAVGIAAGVTGARPQPAAHKVIASGSEARRGARPILAVLGAFDYPPVWPGAALRDGATRS